MLSHVACGATIRRCGCAFLLLALSACAVTTAPKTNLRASQTRTIRPLHLQVEVAEPFSVRIAREEPDYAAQMGAATGGALGELIGQIVSDVRQARADGPVESQLAPFAASYDLRARLESELAAALIAEGVEIAGEPDTDGPTLAIDVEEWGIRACRRDPERFSRVAFRLSSELRSPPDSSFHWEWAPQPEFGRCVLPEDYMSTPARLPAELDRAVKQLAWRIALEWMYP